MNLLLTYGDSANEFIRDLEPQITSVATKAGFWWAPSLLLMACVVPPFVLWLWRRRRRRAD
jgi:hypothetical protein